jgi:hypothetical protein
MRGKADQLKISVRGGSVRVLLNFEAGIETPKHLLGNKSPSAGEPINKFALGTCYKSQESKKLQKFQQAIFSEFQQHN